MTARGPVCGPAASKRKRPACSRYRAVWFVRQGALLRDVPTAIPEMSGK